MHRYTTLQVYVRTYGQIKHQTRFHYRKEKKDAVHVMHCLSLRKDMNLVASEIS